MKIGERQIGPDHPPYIIAEIGVNHDGSPARALELTKLAAEARADAVKFQLFEADRLMSRAAKLAAYQKAAGENDPVEMLQRLELSIDELAPCVEEAHRLGIHAIVSVFSVELVPVAERLAWDAYKSASPDIINRPLLEAMAATGKPLIVSTGASTLDEVERAVSWLSGCSDRLALLQCVSSYPTPPEFAAISAMGEVFRASLGTVGYSDHTEAVDTGAVAVGAATYGGGAQILEKHFTYDRSAKGPDHAASLDSQAFEKYVVLARKAFAWRQETHPRSPYDDDVRVGDGRKRVLPIEQDVRSVSRQSITSTRTLTAGHILAPADLTIKRPGTGIPPFDLHRLIGRRLVHVVDADMPFMAGDVEGT